MYQFKLSKMTPETLANIIIFAPCGGCQHEAAHELLEVRKETFRVHLSGAWTIGRKLLANPKPEHTCGGYK